MTDRVSELRELYRRGCKAELDAVVREMLEWAQWMFVEHDAIAVAIEPRTLLGELIKDIARELIPDEGDND